MKPPLLASALLALLAACAPLPRQAPAPTAAAPAQLRLIGVQALDFSTRYADTLVGGLSGIDYDPVQQRYIAISDDRATHDPARAYTLELHYSASALETPRWTGVRFLQHDSGQRFAPQHRAIDAMDVPDAEAVRWLPGSNDFLWSSEGDFRRGFGPQLRRSRWHDGSVQRHYPLPESFTPDPQKRQGPRANGTLEGIALTPDGRSAWLAMELPWWQDGARASPSDPGAPVRLTAIDLASGDALRQIAYQPDAVPQQPLVQWGQYLQGVSEILADGPHHLLVLERAYSLGQGFHARLYRIDTRQGSNTLALPALRPGNHEVAPKTLVADLADLGLGSIDNLEGMTWGPDLPGGGCVLILVSDNNFNPAQRTQFIAAQYLPPGQDPAQCQRMPAP